MDVWFWTIFRWDCPKTCLWQESRRTVAIRCIWWRRSHPLHWAWLPASILIPRTYRPCLPVEYTSSLDSVFSLWSSRMNWMLHQTLLQLYCGSHQMAQLYRLWRIYQLWVMSKSHYRSGCTLILVWRHSLPGTFSDRLWSGACRLVQTTIRLRLCHFRRTRLFILWMQYSGCISYLWRNLQSLGPWHSHHLRTTGKVLCASQCKWIPRHSRGPSAQYLSLFVSRGRVSSHIDSASDHLYHLQLTSEVLRRTVLSQLGRRSWFSFRLPSLLWQSMEPVGQC